MIKKYMAASLMLMTTTVLANPVERADAHQEWATIDNLRSIDLWLMAAEERAFLLSSVVYSDKEFRDPNKKYHVIRSVFRVTEINDSDTEIKKWFKDWYPNVPYPSVIACKEILKWGFQLSESRCEVPNPHYSYLYQGTRK